MTKRIFRSICFVALCVFLACVILFMGVLYDYFSGVQKQQLAIQTELAAQAVAHEGIDYFTDLAEQEDRITWIAADGTVLYDNKSDSAEMENHLEREEIKEALATGTGESIRYSATLMERSLYCAKQLSDGTVIRLSAHQNTILTLVLGMSQAICVIFVVALVLSLVLASRLSKRIVQPLNELDLNEPLKNDGYDELSPLLHRIHAQQSQIHRQTNELAQKQREFDTVTTGMAEGLVLLNQKRVILSINPSAMRLFGTDNSCVGKFILSVHRDPALQELLLRSGEGVHGESVLELGSGVYQVDASPVISDGQVSGTVLLMMDVTEKQRSEQMRREFTANVSHELKTPLHTISGCAELMANGVVKPEDMNRFSTQIYSEAQRMVRLVDDIIRLSHLDEGADDLKREEVDLYALAEQTVGSLLPVANEAQVQLTLEGETAVMNGIPQLLQGILYNLCDNGIKYNRPGGTVAVTVQNEGQSVRLTVADTGIGIPAEHQERIFERFYRVDKSHSKEIGGTGLGLSIVKHAARLHNASIELISEPGKGTTITVTFPAKYDYVE
jgi:two-component system phosphate regulon sensor histidine kinase PhoR